MSGYWLKNGSLAATGEFVDLLIEDGRIVEVGVGIDAREGFEVVDCTDCVILPGFFDLHVHARSVAAASSAALRGGVTGLVLMPDGDPPVDTGAAARSAIDLATAASSVRVLQSGCITKGLAGEELAGIGLMAPLIPFITDNGRAVESASIMRRAMEYATDLSLPVATHCETASLNRDGAMNEGRTSYALGLPGMPSVSEEICLERDLRLAECTGAHLHVQQVSTAGGVRAIRRAKQDGVSVTCEVSPHHLIFTETDIGDFQTNFKTNPPLRTESDSAALLAGIQDGTIDVIASDHSPQSEFAKASDFGSAPFGVTGLDTALVALHDRFVKPGTLSWSQVIELYSAAPRRLVGEAAVELAEGQIAELVVFDPNAESSIDRAFFGGAAVSSPFSGETLSGAVRHVFCPGAAS